MYFSIVGSVRGHRVRWDRKSGAVEVEFSSFFGSSWERLSARGYNVSIVFELAEAYLRRRR
jgi:hypothetical protein